MRYSSSGDTTVLRALDSAMAPSDLAWRVIGLVNLYRLLVAGGLFLANQFVVMRAVLGHRAAAGTGHHLRAVLLRRCRA